MLDGIVFHGGGETGDVLALGGVFKLEADEVLVLGAGLAQDDHGAESFGVDAGDKEGLASVQFLPQLANLNFSCAHRRL